MKTIKDIARLAKVSIGTVDRVIHNRGGVAKKTELKIRRIIEEIGFTPNLVARNLVLKKQLKIAVLMPEGNEESPFWKDPKLGVDKALSEVANFGFSAVHFYYNQYDVIAYETMLEEVLKGGYDGLILVPHFTKETAKRKRRLDALGIPYVFVNVDLEGFNNLSFVGQESYKSGFLAGRLFDVAMHKEATVLVVNFLEDMKNYHSLDYRVKGVKDYFAKNKTKLTIDELYMEKFNEEVFRREMTKKLIANNSIKCVFFPSSKVSYVGQYLEEFDLEMDVVIGYDITDSNVTYLNKGLITFLIGQEPFNQGYQSVKIIFDFLVNKITPNKSYFSPIQIIAKENVEGYE